jgi:hypothetical protein
MCVFDMLLEVLVTLAKRSYGLVAFVADPHPLLSGLVDVVEPNVPLTHHRGGDRSYLNFLLGHCPNPLHRLQNI